MQKIKIEVREDEYAMILEALRYTSYVKFLNKDAIEVYRKLGIKLGDDDE
ncbi:hypothetical protein AB9M92_01930 [Peribacillus frigoritolerans]|uniref:Uncharacterized protein n=1 Tax=Peribacillus simplex TaxID=1478 RepID=A0A9W4L771_9BACI|nr:hypothetical protein [Peribacillus simplex]CAH0289563.1 hypothetical protein SRABI133_04191 [Peribacillus simplex]